ncbi:MAG TPA: hypothetical protein VFE78_14070 [Gemmataceae bacterium]|jgi:hypothetical protein|nr:hypothetical protein [Gemmataceae bacterium]
MSEKELGKALLNLDALALAGVPDARQQTWQVLERDRRRVRWLTGLTVAVWVLAMLLTLGVLVAFGFLFPQYALMMHGVEQGKLTQAQGQEMLRAYLMGLQKSLLVLALAVAALTKAALLTVVLVFASRRATLRQLNASLIEIAEQLKRLRPAP